MVQFEQTDEKILESKNYFLPCVRRFFPDEPILFVDGKGGILKDSKGKEYIDLLSSHGCALMLGYNHPAVRKAIKEQADKLYAISVEFPNACAVELADLLLSAIPKSLSRVYFANSGAESIEAAIFTAKKYTKRSQFIALYGAFHGRTHGARSLVGHYSLKKGVGPFLSGVVHAPSFYCYRCQLGMEYPACNLQCAKMIEDIIRYATSDEVAAFVAEPIQASAGNIPAPDGYFQVVKEILDKHGILLLMDEIFTSWGGSGKKFCHEHYGVVPDLMTTSKTLGNGLPISAFFTREDIASVCAAPEPMIYYTTFGSNPLVAAGALANIKTILKEKLWERAAKLGQKWMIAMRQLQEKYEIIGDVRGKGVMIGVELVKDRKTKEPATKESQRLIHEAGKRGLILPAGFGWFGNTIRLYPSVMLTEEQIDQAIHIMDESFAALNKG